MQQKEADTYYESDISLPLNGSPQLPKKFILRCGNKTLRLDERTHIMGILNLTPDSFHDGGMYTDKDSALRHVDTMISGGADIIDVGGESTRPGSAGVSEEEELKRVMPVLGEIAKRFDTVISIDTTKERVAREALSLGASIVNDISGLTYSSGIAEAVSDYGAGLIVMHTPSHPLDMQERTEYASLMNDIAASLKVSVEKALQAGVKRESIMIDPGFGFGKTAAQNLILLKVLAMLTEIGMPVTIGTSNKSFIGKIAGNDIEDRLHGTAATVSIGIINGASVVRVHDVARMRSVVRMADAVAGKNYSWMED